MKRRQNTVWNDLAQFQFSNRESETRYTRVFIPSEFILITWKFEWSSLSWIISGVNKASEFDAHAYEVTGVPQKPCSQELGK